MIEFSATEIQAIVLSLQVALVSMVASVPFAVAVAWVLARKEFWGKTLFDSLIHLPLVLPPVAVGYVLLLVLGRNGVVGAWLFQTFGVSIAFTWAGAALAAAVMSFPLMVRAIRLSIEAVDPKLESAAQTLGSGRWRTFWQVTLPLAAPGLLTGSVLGFARALGEFGATITFAGNIAGLTQTLPTALYTAHQTPGGEAVALRLAFVAIVIAFVTLAASEALARRMRHRIAGAQR